MNKEVSAASDIHFIYSNKFIHIYMNALYQHIIRFIEIPLHKLSKHCRQL